MSCVKLKCFTISNTTKHFHWNSWIPYGGSWRHGKLFFLRHFMEANIVMSVFFFLCTSLPLQGAQIPPGTVRPDWLCQDNTGYAQCGTQATGTTPTHAEPPSCLHSLSAVAVWWKKYIYINHIAVLFRGLLPPSCCPSLHEKNKHPRHRKFGIGFWKQKTFNRSYFNIC